MKVCHITSVHTDKDVRIVLKQINTLSQYYDTFFLVNKPTKSDNLNYTKVDLDLNFDSRIKRILTTHKKVLKKAISINADVYHFHDPELIIVGNKLRKLGKKVIYDVHEDTEKQILSKYYIPKILRYIISKIFSYYEKRSAKNFFAIVTATPYLKQKFKKMNHNTIDVNNYPIIREFNDIYNEFQNQTPQLTYIGGLSEERGIFTMIKLANRLKDCKFVFCGEFVNDKDKVKAYNMIKHNNIEFKGFVSRDEIREVLSNSDIGLVLLEKNERYKDSLPIKMFEYMAAGLPVIATDFKLWHSILQESNAGLTVDPKDIDQIVIKIKGVVHNIILKNKMGKNGREYVVSKYNWKNEASKLLDLYSKIEEEI